MPSANCLVRERLLAEYQALLRKHTARLCALSKAETFELAEMRTHGLKEECIAARDALHEHENKHGCAGLSMQESA